MMPMIAAIVIEYVVEIVFFRHGEAERRIRIDLKTPSLELGAISFLEEQAPEL